MFPIANADRCNPATLTALVQRGDLAGLDAITRCYGDKLLQAARRHCRSSAEAEDALQDALLVANREGPTFRGEGSLEGWLVRIVASACRRIGRGAKNDFTRHDVEAETASAAESPEMVAARREVGEQLEAALLRLAPDDRLLLLLAEGEGYDGVEIAQKMGLSHGQVRTRLSRLRKRLREELQVPEENDATP